MAKPIVVIYLPEHFRIGPSIRNAAMTIMQALNGGFGNPDSRIEYPDSRVEYSDYWKEYYWFCFEKPSIETPEFQVFHAKDFTDIEFKELTKLVLDSVKLVKDGQD